MILPIDEYPGYFASDDGKIYSNLGKGNRRTGNTVALYEVKPRIARNGYTRVYLRNIKTNKRQDVYVHRIIAKTFLLNPFNYNVVNHLDCNRQNNEVTNLEWTTTKKNLEYAMRLQRLKRDPVTGRFCA